jgi:hypothetical protein
MFSALISFFGGSVFRMIWGEVSSWATAKQNHDHEIERLQLQFEFEGQQHARNLESIKLQNELGVKVIQVQRDSDMDRLEGEAWTGLVDSTTKLSGITFLDVWNGAIRPLLATLAISVVIAEIVRNGFTLSDWDRELVGAILGIYVADCSLLKRGK